MQEMELKLLLLEESMENLCRPTGDSVLIGTDLLNDFNAVIHTGQGNLRIGEEIISGTLSCDGRVPACNVVSAYENCLTPHESESENIIIDRV